MPDTPHPPATPRLVPVTIRIPEGMPEQILQLTGVKFSTMTRRVMQLYLQQELKRQRAEADAASSSQPAP